MRAILAPFFFFRCLALDACQLNAPALTIATAAGLPAVNYEINSVMKIVRTVDSTVKCKGTVVVTANLCTIGVSTFQGSVLDMTSNSSVTTISWFPPIGKYFLSYQPPSSGTWNCSLDFTFTQDPLSCPTGCAGPYVWSVASTITAFTSADYDSVCSSSLQTSYTCTDMDFVIGNAQPTTAQLDVSFQAPSNLLAIARACSIDLQNSGLVITKDSINKTPSPLFKFYEVPTRANASHSYTFSLATSQTSEVGSNLYSIFIKWKTQQATPNYQQEQACQFTGTVMQAPTSATITTTPVYMPNLSILLGQAAFSQTNFQQASPPYVVQPGTTASFVLKIDGGEVPSTGNDYMSWTSDTYYFKRVTNFAVVGQYQFETFISDGTNQYLIVSQQVKLLNVCTTQLDGSPQQIIISMTIPTLQTTAITGATHSFTWPTGYLTFATTPNGIFCGPFKSVLEVTDTSVVPYSAQISWDVTSKTITLSPTSSQIGQAEITGVVSVVVSLEPWPSISTKIDFPIKISACTPSLVNPPSPSPFYLQTGINTFLVPISFQTCTNTITAVLMSNNPPAIQFVQQSSGSFEFKVDTTQNQLNDISNQQLMLDVTFDDPKATHVAVSFQVSVVWPCSKITMTSVGSIGDQTLYLGDSQDKSIPIIPLFSYTWPTGIQQPWPVNWQCTFDYKLTDSQGIDTSTIQSGIMVKYNSVLTTQKSLFTTSVSPSNYCLVAKVPQTSISSSQCFNFTVVAGCAPIENYSTCGTCTIPQINNQTVFIGSPDVFLPHLSLTDIVTVTPSCTGYQRTYSMFLKIDAFVDNQYATHSSQGDKLLIPKTTDLITKGTHSWQLFLSDGLSKLPLHTFNVTMIDPCPSALIQINFNKRLVTPLGGPTATINYTDQQQVVSFGSLNVADVNCGPQSFTIAYPASLQAEITVQFVTASIAPSSGSVAGIQQCQFTAALQNYPNVKSTANFDCGFTPACSPQPVLASTQTITQDYWLLGTNQIYNDITWTFADPYCTLSTPSVQLAKNTILQVLSISQSPDGSCVVNYTLKEVDCLRYFKAGDTTVTVSELITVVFGLQSLSVERKFKLYTPCLNAKVSAQAWSEVMVTIGQLYSKQLSYAFSWPFKSTDLPDYCGTNTYIITVKDALLSPLVAVSQGRFTVNAQLVSDNFSSYLTSKKFEACLEVGLASYSQVTKVTDCFQISFVKGMQAKTPTTVTSPITLSLIKLNVLLKETDISVSELKDIMTGFTIKTTELIGQAATSLKIALDGTITIDWSSILSSATSQLTVNVQLVSTAGALQPVQILLTVPQLSNGPSPTPASIDQAATTVGPLTQSIIKDPKPALSTQATSQAIEGIESPIAGETLPQPSDSATQLQQNLFANSDYFFFRPSSNMAPKDIELRARIQYISSAGIVRIQFNQLVVLPAGFIAYANKQSCSACSSRRLQPTFDVPLIRLNLGVSEYSNALNYTWYFSSYNEAQGAFDIKLLFNDTSVVSATGTPDLLTINFMRPDFFKTASGRQLQTTKAICEVPKQWTEGTVQESVQAVTQTQKYVTTAVTITNVTLNLYLTVTLSLLWNLINVMQMLTTLPLVDVNHPLNVMEFNKIIASISSFDIIPVGSLLEVMKFGPQVPYSSVFYDMGNGSYSIILNMGLQFVILMCSLTLLPITFFLLYYGSKRLGHKYPRLTKAYDKLNEYLWFNFFIRMTLEIYLDLAILSMINLQQASSFLAPLSLPGDKISILFALVSAVVVLIAPPLFSFHVVRNKDKLEDEDFKGKYGEITEGLSFRHHQVVFMARRLFTAVILVLLVGKGSLQIVILTVTQLGQIIYVGIVQPLETPKQNRQELWNEFVILLSIYHLLLFTDWVTIQRPKLSFQVGWSQCALLTLVIVLGVLEMLIETCSSVKQKAKVCWWNLKKKNQPVIEQVDNFSQHDQENEIREQVPQEKDMTFDPGFPRLRIPHLSVINESSQEYSSDRELKPEPQHLVFGYASHAQNFKLQPLQIDRTLISKYFNKAEVHGQSIQTERQPEEQEHAVSPEPKVEELIKKYKMLRNSRVCITQDLPQQPGSDSVNLRCEEIATKLEHVHRRSKEDLVRSVSEKSGLNGN